MATVAEHLVGRAAELGALDLRVDAPGARAGRRRSCSSASPGSARRACSPSWPRAPTRAAASCSPGAHPSSRPTCRSGSSSTRSRSTSPGSTRAVSRRSTTTCAPSWRSCFPALSRPRGDARPVAPGRALPHPSRRAGAARARRGDDAARARARRRPLGRCRVDRPARRAAAPAARGAGAARAGGAARGRCPERLAGALERAHRAGAADPPRAAARCGARRRPSCSATRSTAALADALYGVSGGNPFYLEQLARSLGRPRPRPAGRDEHHDGRHRGPAGCRRLGHRGARAARRRARAGCWRARRSRATRSSRSWRPPPRRWTRRPPRRRSTTCSRSAWSGPPTCRGAFASATR